MTLSKRQRRIAAAQVLVELPSKFMSIDLNTAKYIPPGMTRAFRNNLYTVMIYDGALTDKGPATQILIQNHTDTPIKNHWSELQKIKNEIFGKEVMAIEYYPKESELINQHNIYWLWVFPDGIIPKKIF